MKYISLTGLKMPSNERLADVFKFRRRQKGKVFRPGINKNRRCDRCEAVVADTNIFSIAIVSIDTNPLERPNRYGK